MSEETAQGAQEKTATETTVNSEVSALKAEAAQRRIENKELREQLDTILANQKIADDKALAEQGEFKTLAEQKAAEAKTLKAQLEELNGTISQYTERDESRLQTLLKDVPENLQETIKNNSGTLAEKLELAEKLSTVKPSAPGARPGGDGNANTVTRQAFDAMDATAKSKFCMGGGTITD